MTAYEVYNVLEILATLNLDRTYVPLPWGYDSMKNSYINGNETKCGMMVGIDLMNQCPDSNRTNNFAIFPAKLKVSESKGIFLIIEYYHFHDVIKLNIIWDDVFIVRNRSSFS